MFSAVLLISLFVMYMFLFVCECDSLISNQLQIRQIRERELRQVGDSRGTEILDIDRITGFSKNRLEINGESYIVGILLQYLPSCEDKPHIISIQESRSSSPGDDNQLLLGSGLYALCKERKQIRLRECSGINSFDSKIKNNTQDKFTITDIRRRSEPMENSVNGKSVDDDMNLMAAELCQPTPCSIHQLMAINTKNAMDCGSFYICIMSQHFLLNCPVDHEFSEEYGVCLEKKYANCKLKESCSLGK